MTGVSCPLLVIQTTSKKALLPNLRLFEVRIGGQMDRLLLRPCAISVAAALALLCLSGKGVAQQPDSRLVTLQPDPAPDVLPLYRDWTKGDEPALSREQTIDHLRAAIKYVCLLYTSD